MSIKQFQINFPGQAVNPRLGHLLTSDTILAATTAGYLDPYIKTQGVSVLDTDFILLCCSDGKALCDVTKNGEIVTLVPITSLR